MISGLRFVSIIASSEKSVAFYEKLGFSVILRKERSYDTVVIMEGYGVQIQLFIDPDHPKRAMNPENLGFRSLSLKVENLDEIRKLFDCSEVMIDWFGNRYCCTQDPDGLPIQFCEG